MPSSTPPADLVAAISERRATLSPKLAGIAAYALQNPEAFIRKTSREICAELQTSEPTLIRFCQVFGYAGLSDFRIDLALGLAGSRQGFVEPLAGDRRLANAEAKQAIARRAAQLVRDDRSLLVDNGSTAEIFAAALRDAPAMTIMTTGIWVAQNALAHGQHTVMLTGGRIRSNAMSMTGRMVETSIGQMHFDTFVMGAASIDADHGLSTFQEDEAHNTRFMLGAARRVIVLADSTKFHKPSLHRICGMSRVDILVTDLPADDPRYSALEAQGTTIITTRTSDDFNADTARDRDLGRDSRPA
ncbi:transcriptional regulator [Paracoccus seriniphilus]|uniref:Transcriptional regulator, RpiR family n=1 Tax=Paracoccus seriniphilus TaxID=184748 RepID=A0A239PU89_9RHOB|nr:transcriptional regulator [Paracoccus seriniphilus]WCR16462.1 transcriptional regulator [Paracoccus seriniphilus]SNT73603.1 transcriptional regulator, RpiR family [Paracoccus seriniphilus]